MDLDVAFSRSRFDEFDPPLTDTVFTENSSYKDVPAPLYIEASLLTLLHFELLYQELDASELNIPLMVSRHEEFTPVLVDSACSCHLTPALLSLFEQPFGHHSPFHEDLVLGDP